MMQQMWTHNFFHAIPPSCKLSAPLRSLLGREDSLCRVQQGCNPDSTCQWPCCRGDPGWPLESDRIDSGCKCTLMEKKEETVKDTSSKDWWGKKFQVPCRVFWHNKKSLATYSLSWVLWSHPFVVHNSLIQSQPPWCSLALSETEGCSPDQK